MSENKWKKESRRKMAAMFLVVVFFSSLFFSLPQKSQAGYPVFDADNLVQSIIDYAIQIIQTGQEYLTAFNTYYIQYKEMVLDPLAWVTSKIALAKEIKKIISFANGKDGGNPKFVTDLASTMLTVSTGAANDFLNGGTIDWNSVLCNPTRTPGYDMTGIKRALTKDYNNNYKDGLNSNFKNKIQCDDIADVIDDIGAFVAGDFNRGGIDGFYALSQSGKTVYDNYTKSQQELDRQIAEAQYNEWAELNWGDGFTSAEIEYDASGLPTTNLARPSSAPIKTPGSLIVGQVNSALAVGKEALVAIDEFSELLTNALAAIGVDALTGGGGGNTGFIGYDLALGGSTLPPPDGSLEPETPPTIDPQIPPDFGGGGGPPPPGGTAEPVNIALESLGATCAQSGIRNNGPYPCTKAIDDNFTDIRGLTTTAITQTIIQPWWQVDLKTLGQPIDYIQIYRGYTGSWGYATALGTFRIFVSDNPFPITWPNNNFNPLSPPAGVQVFPTTGSYGDASHPMGTGIPITISLNTAGRYLRIERVETGTKLLALGEVRIWTPAGPIITLTGPSTMNVAQWSTFTDPGATAINSTDGTNVPVTASVTVNTSIPGPVTITYSATSGGLTSTVSRVVTVVALPVVDLVIDGSDGPLDVAAGTQITPSWTTINAASCVASQGWIGTKAFSNGVHSGTAISVSSSKPYTITCVNSMGNAVSDTVYVNVTGTPQVILSASDGTETVSDTLLIPYNSGVTLSWSSANSTSCTASGDWSGTPAPASPFSTGALTTDKTYAIKCTNGTPSLDTTSAVKIIVQLAGLSCSPSALTATANVTPVTWTAAAPQGGTGVYSYAGGGTDNLYWVGPSSEGKVYDFAGKKSAYVTVTSVGQGAQTITCADGANKLLLVDVN